MLWVQFLPGLWIFKQCCPPFQKKGQGGVVTMLEKEQYVAGKDEKSKRENRIQRFFRETIGELRRVSWPTWPESRRLTIIVVVVLIIMSLFLWLVDVSTERILSIAMGI
jgi:preprotein translocase subunit SecE